MDHRSRREPTFGRTATVLVFGALAVPFGVSKLTAAEPFPAIILPGSPSQVYVAGERTSFTSLNLVAVDASGTEVRLDPRDIMDPLPVQYLGVLAGHSFGQTRPDERIVVKGIGLEFDVNDHHPTDDEQREARAWISERLVRLGLEPHRLLVRYDTVTVNVRTGQEVSRTLLGERAIDLV